MGLLPKAPGTWGSAFGWALIWLLRGQPLWLQGAIMVAITLVSLRAIPLTERQFQTEDDHRIVVDECLGMMLALCAVPWRWPVWLAGFALFRVLDIVKPWPICRLERLPSPWGVLMDDAAAGVAVNAVLQLWLRVAR